MALLLHLAAVAHVRLGDEVLARQLWQMATNLGSPAGVAESGRSGCSGGAGYGGVVLIAREG